MLTFGTSRNGLGLTAAEFWSLSYREYRAHERVWERPHRLQRRMWASIMAGLFAEHKKLDGTRFDMYDWLPDEVRPPQAPPWRTQDVETQKLSIRQMLSFASGMLEGQKQQVN